MYLNLNSFKQLSIEMTTNCNAACPMCSRFRRTWDYDGFETHSPNTEMPIANLSFELFKSRFTLEILKNMELLLFNGKLGDPIMHPKSLEFFKYIRNCTPKPRIHIFTNGSLGTTAYWNTLAQVLTPQDRVIFSIDGLEDTHSIYRQKTSWKKIMNSASQFIASGGTAYWDFIVFSHNEHQVDQAKTLAKEMGFKGFEIRKTNRFKGQADFRYTSHEGVPLKLSKPHNPNYVYEYHDQYLNTHPTQANIHCSFKNSGKAFLSFTGKIWPCSYISEYFPSTKSTEDIIQKYGDTFNDLNHYSIEEIFSSPFFIQDLEASWKNGKFLAKECWKKCSAGHFNITSIEESNLNF